MVMAARNSSVNALGQPMMCSPWSVITANSGVAHLVLMARVSSTESNHVNVEVSVEFDVSLGLEASVPVPVARLE